MGFMNWRIRLKVQISSLQEVCQQTLTATPHASASARAPSDLSEHAYWLPRNPVQQQATVKNRANDHTHGKLPEQSDFSHQTTGLTLLECANFGVLIRTARRYRVLPCVCNICFRSMRAAHHRLFGVTFLIPRRSKSVSHLHHISDVDAERLKAGLSSF